MKISHLVASSALVLALACSAPAAMAQTPMPSPGGVMPADYNFIMQAAFSGWGEIAAGQLAQQHAGNPAVQSLGSMMVRDHTMANKQLAALASARGIAAPMVPDPGREGTVEMLQRMTGPAFAQAYVTEQIADHEASMALFQAEAASTMDPGLRGFAQQQLPVLQHHLNSLESLAAMAAVR